MGIAFPLFISMYTISYRRKSQRITKSTDITVWLESGPEHTEHGTQLGATYPHFVEKIQISLCLLMHLQDVLCAYQYCAYMQNRNSTTRHRQLGKKCNRYKRICLAICIDDAQAAGRRFTHKDDIEFAYTSTDRANGLRSPSLMFLPYIHCAASDPTTTKRKSNSDYPWGNFQRCVSCFTKVICSPSKVHTHQTHTHIIYYYNPPLGKHTLCDRFCNHSSCLCRRIRII